MRPLGSHVTRHTHIPLLVASAKECLHPFTGTLAGKLHAPNGPLRDFTSPAGYHTSNGWGAVHGKGFGECIRVLSYLHNTITVVLKVTNEGIGQIRLRKW